MSSNCSKTHAVWRSLPAPRFPTILLVLPEVTPKSPFALEVLSPRVFLTEQLCRLGVLAPHPHASP